MNSAEEGESEPDLGYRSPVSPYLSISPYVAEFRTFLRYLPAGSFELLEDVFDTVLDLQPETKFRESATYLDDRFREEMGRPVLAYLPLERSRQEVLRDVYELFERGQRRTVLRLLDLPDRRSHLIVVVYAELILTALDALQEDATDSAALLSAVLPLIIRLDRAYGTHRMTSAFVEDAASAEYYLHGALGDPMVDAPTDFEFDVLEYDMLTYGVAVTFRESDLTVGDCADMLSMSPADFERAVAYYDR